jgi:hypothetical protein
VLDPEAAVLLLSRKAGFAVRRFGVYRNNVYASLIECSPDGSRWWRAWSGMSSFAPWRAPISSASRRAGGAHPLWRELRTSLRISHRRRRCPISPTWPRSNGRGTAYHAPDAVPLPLAELAGAIDHAEDAVLTLHPSLGVVRSIYPIVSIFELNTQAGDVPPARLEGGEDAIVARPRLEVELRRLPEGGASFLLALKEEKSIGEAAAITIEQASGFDLQVNLAGLIAGGAIIGVRPQPGD